MSVSSRRSRRRSSASVVATFKRRAGERKRRSLIGDEKAVDGLNGRGDVNNVEGKSVEDTVRIEQTRRKSFERRNSHTARAARRSSIRLGKQKDSARDASRSSPPTMQDLRVERSKNSRRARKAERPGQYRVKQFLQRVRSSSGLRSSSSFTSPTLSSKSLHSSSLSWSAVTSTSRESANRRGDAGIYHTSRSSAYDVMQEGQSSWYDSVHQHEIETLREERQMAARRKARKSIVRHDGSELLTLIEDPENLDSPRLSHLISLLRYTRGYPVQSNYTRFEFPAGVFHSSKYSVKGAQLFASVLKSRSARKELKRLEFCNCYFRGEAVDALLSGIEANKSICLRDFSLRSNEIGTDGTARIADYLRLGGKRLANLQLLDLSDCNLDDECVLTLFEAIIETTGLQNLVDVDLTGRQSFELGTMKDILDDMKSAGLSYVRVHFDMDHNSDHGEISTREMSKKEKKKKKSKKKKTRKISQHEKDARASIEIDSSEREMSESSSYEDDLDYPTAKQKK